ncbi:hypothetical protein GCM10029992_60240 [Glycomyces albus]
MTSPQPGIAVVDKPQGITSHGVVARMRRICGTRKVGHGGTLDPMATGVLIVAVGKGTKLLTYVSGLDKAYAATIRLGRATVTDDAEGEITATRDPPECPTRRSAPPWKRWSVRSTRFPAPSAPSRSTARGPTSASATARPSNCSPAASPSPRSRSDRSAGPPTPTGSP